MTLRVCPRCTSLRLSHNGAYWVCAGCELAISGQALVVEYRSTECARDQIRKKVGSKWSLLSAHCIVAWRHRERISPSPTAGTSA
jgi:molybdenum cofactor biosynthesis enzyme MoaA